MTLDTNSQMIDEFNIESLIEQAGSGDLLEEKKVIQILMKLQEILIMEPSVLVLQSPIVIVGDLHGQLSDLKKLFEEATKEGADPKEKKYLFMGDYVDRGKHSLNTFLLLSLYKLKNPNNIFMLRGNHETRQITMQYGFYNECMLCYGNTGIWNVCCETFDLLPISALTDLDIFSVHGGISPDLPLIEMISTHDNIGELPQEGPLADLCWSDPEESPNATWRQSSRGAGYLFGAIPMLQFSHLNRLSISTRSHQVVKDGFKGYFMDASDEKKISSGTLVNVWSAPNYAYTSGNLASFMMLRFPDKDEDYKMITFDEAKERVKLGVEYTNGYFA